MKRFWLYGACAPLALAAVALACATMPALPPNASSNGRTASASCCDGVVTVTGNSLGPLKDTSIHIVGCWDEGESTEAACDEADADGSAKSVKTKAKMVSSKCPAAGGSGHTYHYVISWDKGGTIVWAQDGTCHIP